MVSSCFRRHNALWYLALKLKKMAVDEKDVYGSWEKDRVLGCGGFGTVTLWKNKVNDEMIAIKKCRWGIDSLMTPRHKERWSREVEIMQRLSHPNVVRAVPVPDDLQAIPSELPLLCMEYCSKGDLRQILNRPENCCGLCEADVRCLISDIKDAVQYLHKEKITHRDLKPENIVLQEGPDSQVIYKLIDLGYAKELDQSSVCTSFVGTLQYLAPELFLSKTYTSSVDYWSLGLVAHEVITGVRPFLPNMPPVNWMTHVQKKSSNDICVYQSTSNEIVFSQRLFVENHISQCLREEMEKWLRLALEWDPKKRGRSQADELVIFSQLTNLLQKKIITLFCVIRYEQRSYEIDSATSVATLKLWIERDSKQSVADQMLMLPSGKQLGHDDLAISCWDLNQNPMLYIFSVSGFQLPDIQLGQRLPPLVTWMMKNPPVQMEYAHQKRIWSHAVFFVRQEMELYQTFLDAYAVKMLALMENSSNLRNLKHSVSTEIQQVVAMHKLMSDSFDFDTKCYKKISACASINGVVQLLSDWSEEISSISVKVEQLKEAMDKMEVRIEESCACTENLQAYQEPGQQELRQLGVLRKSGYKCYDNLRQLHRQQVEKKTVSADMIKVVYHCLKTCDKALRDENFMIHLKQVFDNEKEISALDSTLNLLKQHIGKVKAKIEQCQFTRQKDIWRLVSNLSEVDRVKQKNSSSPVTVPTIKLPPPILSTSPNSPFGITFDIPPRTTCTKPVLQLETKSLIPLFSSPQISPCTSPIPFSARNFDTSEKQQPLNNTMAVGGSKSQKNSTLDSSLVIKDNLNMRYLMQDYIVQFTKNSQSLVDESLQLDWSYLDKLGDIADDEC